MAKNFFMDDFSLERFLTGFAGADADDLLDVENKDLAVADLAGAGRLFDGFDDLIEQVVLDRSFDLYLGQEVDDIFSTTVKFGMSFLTAEPLDLSDGDALHANSGKRFTHLVKLEWLDDGSYEFHECILIN